MSVEVAEQVAKDEVLEQVAQDSEKLMKLRSLLTDAEDAVLDIDQIYVNTQTNTRDTERAYTAESLNSMMAQIRAVGGIMHPLLVYKIKPAPDNDHKEYCLLDGFRRALALIELASQPGEENYGKAIKCTVVKGGHEAAALTAVQLLENLARRPLTAMEISNGLAEMLKADGITQRSCAAFFGMNEVTVSNMLKLQRLPQEIQDLVSDGKLAWTAAREIVRDIPEPSWKEYVEFALEHTHGELMDKISDYKDSIAAKKDGDESSEVSTGKDGDQQRGTQLIKGSLLKTSYLPFLQKKLEAADKSTPKYTEADLVQARLDTINTVMMNAGTKLSQEIAPFIADQLKAEEEEKKNKDANEKKNSWYRSLIKEAEELYKKESKPDVNNPAKKFSLADAITAVLQRVNKMTAEEVGKLGFSINTQDIKTIGEEFNATYKLVAVERKEAAEKRAATEAKKKAEADKKKADEEAAKPTPATATA